MAPELKSHVEGIFGSLGLNPSQAIVMFYRQVELHNGLPFDVKLPVPKPLNMDTMTKDEFDIELEKGFASVKAGRTRPFSEFRSEFDRNYAHAIFR